MPQLTTVKLAALNIKMHPHSVEKYISLMRDAHKLHRDILIQGDRFATLATLYSINRDNESEGLYGEIYRFTDIDRSGSWLNTDSRKEATEEERNTINIPDNLKPNCKKFHYVFFPVKHTLIVEIARPGDSFSIYHAQKFFSALLNDTRLEEYPDVDVIIEQSREHLERMLSIYQLQSVDIKLTKPNPDDFDEAEQELFRQLDEQNAQSYETLIKAAPKKSLKLNKFNKTLARAAVRNGVVNVAGKNADGGKVEGSTIDHPFTDSFQYSKKDETFSERFFIKAMDVLAKLLL